MGNSVQSSPEKAPADKKFLTFMAALTEPLGSFGAGIGSLSNLIAAEETMDAMAADENCGLFYQYLEVQAENFLKANPALLAEPWVRNGGAVHDMIERLRPEMNETRSVH